MPNSPNELIGPALQRVVMMGVDETGKFVPFPIAEGGVAMSNATNDHGSLSGLADDDHPQYALLTASNVFTGATQSVKALKILDSGSDHYITIDTASDEAADRTLTIPALGAAKYFVITSQSTGKADLTTDVTGVLPSTNGGTGVNNAGTITNASNTTITGGGTLALGGFTLTVPATGTAAELGQVNVFTANQIVRGDSVYVEYQKTDQTAYGDIQYVGASGDIAQGGMDLGSRLDLTINRWTSGNFYVCNGSNAAVLTTKKETGITSLKKGSDVASAAAIVPTGNLFHVTGTADITSITSTNIIAGTRITMIFDGNAATTGVTDGSNLKLAGNFAYTADDTLTLVYDGTNWYECCRSVN